MPYEKILMVFIYQKIITKNMIKTQKKPPENLTGCNYAGESRVQHKKKM